MKKILFIVTERYSANGICVNSVMHEFTHNNYEVFCVVNREIGDEEYFEKDRVHFYTVRPRLIYRIDSYLRTKTKLTLLSKFLSILSIIINKFQLLFSIPTWPLISRSYTNRIYKVIKRLHESYHFDIIIPVYTQIDTIIAANRLKDIYTSIIVIPYMLDSLASGYGPKCFSKKWTEKRGLAWEKKLFRDVSHIIMMKSSEEFYNNHSGLPYFNKISFLDIPLFVAREYKGKSRREKLIISYVGSIPSHIRNPQYFLEVFKNLNIPNVVLKIVGPSTCEELISSYVQSDSRIQREFNVPHSKAIDIIKDSDILVNLGNNITTMMPSKIFEYISFGKPIISTAPIVNEPCIRYLELYKNACVLYEEDLIEISVKKMSRFIADSSCINPQLIADEFTLNRPETFYQLVCSIMSKV